ncbi:MAG: glycosyltransferase, partial [Mucilaginibacter polytrichastri]|nr:glycosyltransferase [Mucilaginibacter polytrichastri]
MLKTALEIIFWICLFVPVYNYGGYAFIVVLLNKIFPRKKTAFDQHFVPEVTLLVAAYNEENEIRQKIENSLQLDYPKNKLKIAFVTDGSTDRTPEIVREYEGILLFHEAARRGKAMAINRVMPLIESPVVIFCDANTEL